MEVVGMGSREVSRPSVRYSDIMVYYPLMLLRLLVASENFLFKSVYDIDIDIDNLCY